MRFYLLLSLLLLLIGKTFSILFVVGFLFMKKDPVGEVDVDVVVVDDAVAVVMKQNEQQMQVVVPYVSV